MKKTLIILVLLLVWTILVSGVTTFYNYKFGEKPKPEIVYKEKVVSKIVYRDYKKMSEQEKTDRLVHYDQDPFKLDINKLPTEDEMFRITGELYERRARRDVRIKCSETSNWKFYVGVAVVAGVVGYGIYKVAK